ncbi:hypothetical protein D3C72_1709890 [compost metagenome]
MCGADRLVREDPCPSVADRKGQHRIGGWVVRQGLGLLFTGLGCEGFVDFLAVLAPVRPNLDADVVWLGHQRIKLC